MDRKIIVFSVIAALVTGFFVGLPFLVNASYQRPCFVFLDDPAMSLVLPGKCYEEFKKGICGLGFRFEKITLNREFFNKEQWQENLDSILNGVTFVMASPLITATLESENYNFGERLPKIKSYGISYDENNCFDMILSSDVHGGWLEAEKAVDPDEKIAVLYEDDRFSKTSQSISENHGTGSVLEKKVEISSVLSASNILKEFEELGIGIVMCPFVRSPEYYFKEENSLKWIVDYRFVLNVPQENLYGVVYPDFFNSVLPYLGVEREVLKLMSGTLNYGFTAK